MQFHISRPNKYLEGELKVPASKSISNRLLIIQALCDKPFKVNNISDSEDSKVLIDALKPGIKLADIGHAGTSMRFLTAYFASHEGEMVLTGSARMKERPIGNLVEALRKLGADISYTEKEGFPPLYIKGKQLAGGCISIDSSVSSQFISALLLSAPTFKNGLELELENKVISSSYIELTLRMMEYMGVNVKKTGNRLHVLPKQYIGRDITVEGDWSGVSYWYQIATFAETANLFIHSLQANSFQGDARCAEIFAHLGIETKYENTGIKISKTGKMPGFFEYNFIESPDIVQTLAVTCVMLNIPFRFSGTQSLRIKETDRIAALQNELGKFGAVLNYSDNGILEWNGILQHTNNEPIAIKTYDDHRMAMAFAPIAMLEKNIIIENPEVVVKSYPGFWNDLSKMGFSISEIENKQM